MLCVCGEGWKGKIFELVNGTVFNYFCVPQTFSLDSGLTSFCQLSIQAPVQPHQCYEACSEHVTWLDVIFSLGGLQSMGSQRIGCNWACTHSLVLHRGIQAESIPFLWISEISKTNSVGEGYPCDKMSKKEGMREQATWIGKGHWNSSYPGRVGVLGGAGVWMALIAGRLIFWLVHGYSFRYCVSSVT